MSGDQVEIDLSALGDLYGAGDWRHRLTALAVVTGTGIVAGVLAYASRLTSA